MNLGIPASAPDRSIRDNFRSMPGWLKFFTIHALACVLVVPLSLTPTPDLQGDSSMALLTSEAGRMVLMAAGFALAAAGVLLLLRRRLGRILYLGFFAMTLVGGYLAMGQLFAAVIGATLSWAVGVYLFRNDDVRAYFYLPPLHRTASPALRTWGALVGGNAIPILSLSLIALMVLYLFGISDQPRMADGALSGEEMSLTEKVLTMVTTFSIFAAMFVALRRAARAGRWFWFVVCLFVWPVSYAYTLLVNRNDS